MFLNFCLLVVGGFAVVLSKGPENYAVWVGGAAVDADAAQNVRAIRLQAAVLEV